MSTCLRENFVIRAQLPDIDLGAVYRGIAPFLFLNERSSIFSASAAVFPGFPRLVPN